MRAWKSRSGIVLAASLLGGCATQSHVVSSAELERVVPQPARTSSGPQQQLDADEHVATAPKRFETLQWSNHTSLPALRMGQYEIGTKGVKIASAGKVAETVGIIAIVGAGSAGVACATEAICDRDSGRIAGIVTLSAVGALLAVGLVLLAVHPSTFTAGK